MRVFFILLEYIDIFNRLYMLTFQLMILITALAFLFLVVCFMRPETRLWIFSGFFFRNKF